MRSKNWKRHAYYRLVNEQKVIPALVKLDEIGQAERMRRCGEIVHVAQCVRCGAKHFKGYSSCRERWCLNCMHKKLLCWIAVLMPIFEMWYETGNYLSMLNFTVRDAMPLLNPLRMLEGAYRLLYNGNGKRSKWNERFPGGIRSLEVKIGEGSGMWHPHYHAIVMQPGDAYEKDYEWLSERWHEIVGHNGRHVARKDGTPDMDWNGNVWVKKIDSREEGGVLKAVCETLKYILKIDEHVMGRPGGGEVNMALFEDAYWTLKGKRQVSTWGLLYGAKKKVQKEFEKNTEEALVDFICQRCGCREGVLLELLYSSLAKDVVLLDMGKEGRNAN